MNLWDLEIDKIPCGWEKTYQEALVHCPNGENIEFDDFDSERTYFHPVKCHDLIINKFNTLKKEAKILLENRNKLDLNTFVSQIVYIDTTLYTLLGLWQASDTGNDCSSYDPEKLGLEADYAYYFDEDFKSKFFHLRLVNRSGKQ